MISQPNPSSPLTSIPIRTTDHNKHSYPSVSRCPDRRRSSITRTTTTIERTPRSTYYTHHTSHTMSSPQGSPAGRVGQSYMLVPNLHVPDQTVEEVELGNSNAWMVATVIEDDDLMFGGKPLSAWYEEDRRRLSSSNEEEEEIRGRQRDRVRLDAHHHHQYHHHQHHHHHQAQHHHQHQHHTAHHTHVAHTHHTTKKTSDIKHWVSIYQRFRAIKLRHILGTPRHCHDGACPTAHACATHLVRHRIDAHHKTVQLLRASTNLSQDTVGYTASPTSAAYPRLHLIRPRRRAST